MQRHGLLLGRARSWKSNVKRGRCEIGLPFLACEAGKGNGKRGKREIRLPFSACEAGKGNEKRGKGRCRLPLGRARSWKRNGKRGKSEIRLLVSPTPRKKKKQVITEVKGNAPAAAPRRQDAALPRSLVFLWQLRL